MTDAKDPTKGAMAQQSEPNSTPPTGAPDYKSVSKWKYFDDLVSGPLTEALKLIARERPSDPLRFLGEFFLQKSKELEQ